MPPRPQGQLGPPEPPQAPLLRHLHTARPALFWSTSRRFSALGVPVGNRVPGVERSEPPESHDRGRSSPDHQPPWAFCSAKSPLPMIEPSPRAFAPSSVAASRHNNNGVSALRAASSPGHVAGHHDPLSVLLPPPTPPRPQEPASRRTGGAGQNDECLMIGRKPISAISQPHGPGTAPPARTQAGRERRAACLVFLVSDGSLRR